MLAGSGRSRAVHRLALLVYGAGAGGHYLFAVVSLRMSRIAANKIFGKAPVLAVLLFFLLGCVGQQQQRIAQVLLKPGQQHWSVKGKIGCQNGRRGGSVTFQWQQKAEAYEARLVIPPGRRQIRLLGAGAEFQVVNAAGVAYSEDALRRSWSALGDVRLPITSLPYWLRRLPDPKLPLQSTAPAGFRQNGWSLSWRAAPASRANALVLPALLRLTAPPVSCRIALWNWQLSGSN